MVETYMLQIRFSKKTANLIKAPSWFDALLNNFQINWEISSKFCSLLKKIWALLKSTSRLFSTRWKPFKFLVFFMSKICTKFFSQFVFLMKMNNFCSYSKVPAIIPQCNIPSSADNFEESSEQELLFFVYILAY